MSDALELVLKEAIKKIMAEAMAEAMAERLGQPMPCPASPLASRMPPPVASCIPTNGNAPAIRWERMLFSLKALGLAAFALGMCGMASAMLFPTSSAQAANDMMWAQSLHRQVVAERHDPTSLNQPNDPDVAACMAENGEDVPESLTWSDLFNFNKVEAMLKHNVFLHASPDDLTAIVIFYELKKMIKGEPITLADLPDDFKNSLPCQWRPVFAVVTANYPHPTPLPPVPDDFIMPPDFY